MQPPARLKTGLEALALPSAPRIVDTLLQFLALLLKWNRTYNLTAITTLDEMIVSHVLDSLTALPFLKGPQVIDVGTGGGLPGIPLALLRDDLSFVLLDSNSKKTHFLTHAIAQLSIPNVQVVHARVETWQPTQSFNTIITRAVAAIPTSLQDTHHLIAPDGQWVFMKGHIPEEDLRVIPTDYTTTCHPITVPFYSGARHIITVNSASQQ